MRSKIDEFRATATKPFKLLTCAIKCGDAGVRWDKNTHDWRCKKCGTSWGDLE